MAYVLRIDTMTFLICHQDEQIYVSIDTHDTCKAEDLHSSHIYLCRLMQEEDLHPDALLYSCIHSEVLNEPCLMGTHCLLLLVAKKQNPKSKTRMKISMFECDVEQM